MSTLAPQSRSIEGHGRTVRQLLSGQKYSIDYYQREYKWEPKQIEELLGDLEAKFSESYEPGHERSAVAQYGHYFLGSIIISDHEGQRFIIDGQQRLTSLTLILIFLLHHLEDADQKSQLSDLVFSQRFGKRSFNLDIPEREPCMEALYRDDEYVDTSNNESIKNILARYSDIEEAFPEDLRAHALPYFADWLVENVHLVEITAYSDGDAYTIFETMNDRGLSLTPADMLKGYLLANMSDAARRSHANTIWKTRTQALTDLGKDEDADAIKAWLRSQHAETIRERARGSKPQDFELVGTEFHRWVRDRQEALGLVNGAEFSRFIESDFAFYSLWYERLRKSAESPNPEFIGVRYNALHKFTLQYPLLMAPLVVGEPDAVSARKVRIVAAFVDVLIHQRMWNWKATDYSTMHYNMFVATRDIRRKDPEALVEILRAKLREDQPDPWSKDTFGLTQMNRPQIHRMLARITDFVETNSGVQSRYNEYITLGKKGYEVEHIWANMPSRHVDEFPFDGDFRSYRNRLGGLLLLPKSFNASYGALPYAEKLDHYNGQNLLARSLHAQAYDHNPGFLRFIQESGLPFKPHAEFKKADMDERQELYREICKRIWSEDRLTVELTS